MSQPDQHEEFKSNDLPSKYQPTVISNQQSSKPQTPLVAPLHIPPVRRLQTFCVLVILLFPLICIGLNAYFLFRVKSTVIFCLYVALLTYSIFFMRLPSRGGLASETFRSLPVFSLARDYFPLHVHCEDVKLDPSRSYLIGYHPHGILSVGALLTWGTAQTEFSKRFSYMKARLCTLDAQFRLPFWNVVLLSMGLVGCSRAAISYVLKRPGHVCALVLGGAKESLDAFSPPELPLQPLAGRGQSVGTPPKPAKQSDEQSNDLSSASSKQDIVENPVLLHLSHRRGFVQLALQNGASLIPAFGFGELSLWEQVPNPRGSKLRKVQETITSILGFAPPVFSGRGVFQYRLGLLPRRQPINIHIGQPIDCPKTSKEHCSHEIVEHYYNLYREELTRVFDLNKHRYPDMVDATLIFV